jgi:hypothetical protein
VVGISVDETPQLNFYVFEGLITVNVLRRGQPANDFLNATSVATVFAANLDKNLSGAVFANFSRVSQHALLSQVQC